MEDQLRDSNSLKPVVDENLLWSRFQQGDIIAFKSIYQGYVNKLYNYGIKVCNETPLVKDCIQDLFIELWSSRERLSSSVQIEYYLFKSLRRKIISKLQKDKKAYLIIKQSVSKEDLEVKSIETKIISETNKSELHAALSWELHKLPDRQKLKFLSQIT